MGDMKVEDGEILRVPSSEGAQILANLSHRDLLRLRAAVKRQYMKFYPVEFFTDREADRIIESIAPSIVEKLIRRHVDGKEHKEGYL